MPIEPPSRDRGKRDPDDAGRSGSRREPQPADVAPAEPEPQPRRLTRLASSAEPVVGRVASAARAAVGAAVDRWEERPGARVRRLRRLARTPIASLYERHPEARRAFPREIGVRPIPVDMILGSAVGGATQRGADFLPLKPFRGTNWAGRWQRIRAAVERMAMLPPIDVVAYGGGYWVLDGHNRVAAALYSGQVAIDANVTELVPPGGVSIEPRALIAPGLMGARELLSTGAPPAATPPEPDDLPPGNGDEPPADPRAERRPPGR